MPENHPKKLEYQPPQNGILVWLPAAWVPYVELTRMKSIVGCLISSWQFSTGLSFAACISDPVLPVPQFVMVAAPLAFWWFVMRAALLAWNDNLDQDFDRQVTRTQCRPIARGAISTAQAHTFTFVLIFVGTTALLLLPPMTMMYATLITAIMMIYPLGKRVTDFPAVTLGMGYGVGIFLGCAALGVDPLPGVFLSSYPSSPAHFKAALCLCGVNILSTLNMDIIYAHLDVRDDVHAGVRSFAVRAGDKAKRAVSSMATVQVFLLAMAGVESGFSAMYYTLSCGGTVLVMGTMLQQVDLADPDSCFRWFIRGTTLLGTFPVAGLLEEYLVRYFL